MKIIIFILLVFAASAVAADKKEKIITEYKKYEKFNLGDLEVKGDLIAPGDITVKERARVRIDNTLYERNEYFDMIKNDFMNIR
jgi:hypothetical protein